MPEHRPRKRFGQHFLHDPAVIARIVEAVAPAAGDTVVEIGPGSGAITIPLLKTLGTMTVVEIDRDLAEELPVRTAAAGRIHIVQGDALRVDYRALSRQQHPLRVVGNLPYNISTPLLFRLYQYKDCIRDMHFMLQKEVVDRMTAVAGSRNYGRLSVMTQWHCRTERLFDIGAGAFRPAPQVQSSFLRLLPRRSPASVPAQAEEQRLAAVVRLAFGQRRKTLRNALRQMVSEAGFRAADIDPGRRAETLSLEEFVRLSREAAVPQKARPSC